MYTQRPPDPRLVSIVDAMWTSREAEPAMIVPDGCIDLIFHVGPAGPQLIVSELLEEAERYHDTGWWAGVRFRPGMARTLLDLDPVDCRGREHAARDLGRSFAELEEQLAGCTSGHMRLLESFVERHFDQRWLPPLRVRRALERLSRTGRVDAVAAELSVSPRTLHRDVLAWTGLSPKLLARIFRAGAARDSLDAGERVVDVAASLGFADQAHLSRELAALRP